FGDPDPSNKSVFLHHGPGERWPYQGLALTVRVARLLSLAFTLGAIALTYAAARQVRPGDLVFAWLAAGLIALNPMVVFMSAVVQNDAAALAAGAAVAVCLGRVVQRPLALPQWLLAGVVLGLGILLKAGLLVMAAPLAAAGAWRAWQAGGALGARLRALVTAVAGLALPVLGLAGWWLLRNWQLYGDLTANNSIIALWGPLSPEQQRTFLPFALYTLATGLLGRFGNGGIIEFSPAVYALAGLLALAALAGLVRRVGRAPRPRLAALWWLHALTVVVVAVSVLIFALRFNGGATGKYLFPAYPSLAVLLAAGWLAWFRRPSRRRRAVVAMLALCLAAVLYAIFGLLRPAYGPPRGPWPGELSRARPLEADLGGAARVLGSRLSADRVRPGEALRVTTYWLPQDYTPGPFTVFVHLAVPGSPPLAQVDLYPGGGTYPTDVWTPGRAFVDTYTLRVPPDAPAGPAEVLLGLYDEQSGQRLAATGADAGPAGADWIVLGSVTIAP
ncbi:MAG: phospholipid carrier-dependent glycosyltransferase, partial [Anaerolineales bacterium]|nr:phospholipid carrier-dependent glycosyltransferase [Anaerolineales bacterium]